MAPIGPLRWDHCTFAMIKPDAQGHSSEIIKLARDAGFAVAQKLELTLSRDRAEQFYQEHKGRPFFPDLIDFMISGPIVALALRREDSQESKAVSEWRQFIGPTDPENAKKEAPESLRARFGTSVTKNAVHGSDSEKSAEREIRFFFPTFEPSMLTAAQSQEYLTATVAPVLSNALMELCKVTPDDPIDWLGKYLISSNPQKPTTKIFFVLGGPGSGKGTQCARLVEEFGFAHFSAGDLLRGEVSSGSEEGKMIGDMIKEGKIVPGHITIGLLGKAISTTDAKAVLIDGFPRQLDQAGAFEKDVSDFECVLFFDCPEEVMEQRLLKRGETSGRTDDNAESIKKRFRTFVETSMPVVQYYSAKGKVHKIDATLSPEDVFDVVKSKIRGYIE
eukprot:CAMPEP_0198312022 /NCGR_PEP_ID=MMETSP1450-20131203/3565_1 /TAXON_ID=753684 ORGANISM="Madagascaria erythrocladiodes, Strain CCMP3234" /NCGR_SAMPLE_ID=MMETSP1450 /ASSEMBLY_ACC=CAM_ASM_001115 /LENGTH=389 /DNA_ID=CAMNT_0044014947 /DNA_START=41 /DNA_END=1210 /DNA_ORIENTATION=+